VDKRSLAHPRTLTEKPTTAVYAGCSGEYPRREMVYLHEENHDNLVLFHGDRVCQCCARRFDVSY
jgi:hypothetical protein